jgi:hypothetical protein
MDKHDPNLILPYQWKWYTREQPFSEESRLDAELIGPHHNHCRIQYKKHNQIQTIYLPVLYDFSVDGALDLSKSVM